MGAEGFPGLGPEIRHVPDGYFQHVVLNGRDGNPDLLVAMSPFPSTSEEDLTAIWTWLDSQPKPTTAQGLYTDYCANCHGKDGAGVPGKDLKTLVEMIPTVVRAGANLADPANVPEYMPAFPADKLTDAEVQLIADFVTALASQ